MAVYKLEKLMEETRRLAADYRQSTGQTLPVSTELARYDAMRLLGLSAPANPERGVDAVLTTEKTELKIQIKGRVIFDKEKKSPRIGQLNLDADWDLIMLVVMNSNYQTEQIYQLDRKSLKAAIQQAQDNQRGAMSVRKFEKLAERVWSTSADRAVEE